MPGQIAYADIIAFPYHRLSSGRLTVAERVAALQWETEVAGCCYAQVTFDDAAVGQDAPGARTYARVYCKGELWSVVPAILPGMRCALRRRLTGARVGEYASIRAALDAILVISATIPATLAAPMACGEITPR